MDRRKVLIGGGAAGLALAGGALVETRRMGSMEDYAEAQDRLRQALAARPTLPDLIRFASLAPSGHNTQPWRLLPAADRITILPDWSRRTPVVDPDDHHLFVSLGCLAETLDLAARHCGQGGNLAWLPAQGGGLTYRFGREGGVTADLVRAIPLRQSTRAPFDGRPCSAETLARLDAAASLPGVQLRMLTDRQAVARMRDLVLEGNALQMADPAFVRELRDWLRFNPCAAMAHGDGLFSASSGNPVLPSWLGPPLFDLTFATDAENAKYRQQMDSSAGLAVFAADHPGPEGWVAVGRACQRFALEATAQGLKLSFVNQPVEVAALRGRAAELAGMPGTRPDLVLRFGYGDPLPYSFRRPVRAILA